MPKTGKKPELRGRKTHSRAFSCPASLCSTSIVLCCGKCQDKMLNFRGGVGNFVKRAQNKPKICDRMTGQTCTKIREQTENRSNLYTKKNDFTAVSKGFGQGFGRSGQGHRPAECRQAEEGASPGKTKEPANARSTFAGSGSSGYTRAAP